ncbi:hypothetical protein MSMAW_0385 [Methanosarcina mazei WWM610]|jgi:hypothetical protein|uniref:Uncharacterized protein n=5 Tax=Methanosarcina mazei TaxID=2209 RepID=M1PVV5_METMZ|nr:hypothetical protein MmTuc01_0967 [Methanosarcina mazei Tuc01]AKB39376.1 hypothetical protein MSMAW_0385 [Methanosarcina mazei WWM610]AKB63560.1 hypothetical protein MSMAS_0364 [Methanosarcina mazei S-6]AKB66918.1 hypothetical protein MSMAL_0375 [Methanosarcina mazei LYC]AKB70272.1 hypothetical protein MSMAC_0382 [Methanosarcina mazei C16]UWJ21753.1 hypothetical protein MSMAT_0496 [Methanosarcina mazei TMA]
MNACKTQKIKYPYDVLSSFSQKTSGSGHGELIEVLFLGDVDNSLVQTLHGKNRSPKMGSQIRKYPFIRNTPFIFSVKSLI